MEKKFLAGVVHAAVPLLLADRCVARVLAGDDHGEGVNFIYIFVMKKVQKSLTVLRWKFIFTFL